MRRIQRKKHKLGTYEIDKTSLSCFDVFDDGIYTLACFHKDSVTSRKKKLKDCNKEEEIRKDCNILYCDKKDCHN